MNYTNKKTKGFTLMELLVVIVILALLIMLAGPQVLNLMETGKTSTFRSEAHKLIQISETAFTDINLRGNKVTYVNSSGVTETVEISVTGNVKELCITLDELVNLQYLDKDLGTSWKGAVNISIPINNGAPTKTISVTNGEYTICNASPDGIDSASLTGGSCTFTCS